MIMSKILGKSIKMEKIKMKEIFYWIFLYLIFWYISAVLSNVLYYFFPNSEIDEVVRTFLPALLTIITYILNKNIKTEIIKDYQIQN